MAGDAGQSVGAHELVAGILGFLEVGDFRKCHFLERVDLAEKPDEAAHVGFAELWHRGIQIIALAFSVEQNFSNPFRFQFRAHVGQRRGQTTLIAQGWLGAGE